MQEWALYAQGQFISAAVGGAEYQEENNRMTWSDVLETIKSNALMRLCKDLGIASECWDKKFTRKFQQEYCVQVWVDGKNRPLWRRMDSPAFYKEKGPTDDSPNKEKLFKGKSDAAKTLKTTTVTPKEPVVATKVAPTVVQPVAEGVFAVIDPAVGGKVEHIKETVVDDDSRPVNPAQEPQFIAKFVGDGRTIAAYKHLKNHLRSHYKVDTFKELTRGQLKSLVGYCKAHMGDPTGFIDPKYYAEEIKEVTGDTPKDLGPITADGAKTDPVAVVERWNDVLGIHHPKGKPVSMDAVLSKTFGGTIYTITDAQREQLWNVMDAIDAKQLLSTEEAIVETIKLG
jgi:hypothetical protein